MHYKRSFFVHSQVYYACSSTTCAKYGEKEERGSVNLLSVWNGIEREFWNKYCLWMHNTRIFSSYILINAQSKWEMDDGLCRTKHATLSIIYHKRRLSNRRFCFITQWELNQLRRILAFLLKNCVFYILTMYLNLFISTQNSIVLFTDYDQSPHILFL